jgi:FKBP12-rapamycin complex-associated protein
MSMLGRHLEAMEAVDKLVTVVADRSVLFDVKKIGCLACICCQEWDHLKNLVVPGSEDVDMLISEAIVAVYQREYDEVETIITKARKLLDTPLSLALTESIERSEQLVLQAQMLVELQEMLMFTTVFDAEQRLMMMASWNYRLTANKHSVRIWEPILNLRALILEPSKQQDCFIRLSSMCLKERRVFSSNRYLEKLLGKTTKGGLEHLPPNIDPEVMYAYIKHVWHVDKSDALVKLNRFVKDVQQSAKGDSKSNLLLSRLFSRLGYWTEISGEVDEETRKQIEAYYFQAVQLNQNAQKAWHHWAFVNFDFLSSIEQLPPTDQRCAALETRAAKAVQGFFRSIMLDSSSFQQDALRLMKICLTHGHLPEVRRLIVHLLIFPGPISNSSWAQ